jgi:rubrerythrin
MGKGLRLMAIVLPTTKSAVEAGFRAAGYSFAYYDETTMRWHCADCDAVLRGDGDCPRCDEEATG